MPIRLVTYATHSEGLFDKLVNNDLRAKIDVVGWGVQWTGFADKINGFIAYLDKCSPDDIVVFLDGFDTVLVKSAGEIEQRFLELDCKVLVSMDLQHKTRRINKRIFGTCKNGTVANAGMYMGYAKYLRVLLTRIAQMKCSDDQVNLNTACSEYDFIEIDTRRRIFYNSSKSSSAPVGVDTCAVSYPGTLTFKRIKRAVLKEYPQFFIKELLVLAALLIYKFPNKKWTVVLVFLLCLKMWDTSCMVSRRVRVADGLQN